MYKITIDKYEELSYDEKLERAKSGVQRGWNRQPSDDELNMENMKFSRQLSVTLTAEQFEKVKKAVLAEM